MLPQWLTDLVVLVPWLVALTVLIWVIVKLYPTVKKIIDFADDVAGEGARPGVAARPGLMERMSNFESQQNDIKQKLNTVHHELFPNSGKSLRDQTNRIEEKLNADDERLIEVDKKVVALEGVLNAHLSVSTDILSTIKEEK